jgi:hypothetical protein
MNKEVFEAYMEAHQQWMNNPDVDFYQLFAEAIVRQTCDLIKENEFKLVPGFMQRMTADAEYRMIYKHFGMKTNDEDIYP